MTNNAIALLYIKHLIEPVEELIKNTNFNRNYSKEENEKINQFLLKQYRNLEAILDYSK